LLVPEAQEGEREVEPALRFAGSLALARLLEVIVLIGSGLGRGDRSWEGGALGIRNLDGGSDLPREHQGPFERHGRRRFVPGLGEGDPEPVPGDEVARGERDRPPVRLGGRGPLVPKRTRHAEMEPRLGVLGGERDRPAEGALGLGGPSEVGERDPVVGPCGGVGGVFPDDLSKGRRGALVFAPEEEVYGDIEAMGHTRYPAAQTRRGRKSLPSQPQAAFSPSTERCRRTGAALYATPGVSRSRNPRAQPDSSVSPVLFL